jgi:CheY-like chemotaxis protein
MDLRFSVIPIAEIASSAGGSQERPFVLVADDDPLIADTLTAILSMNGFTAVAAYDGSSALEIAEKTAPALLLSNIAMFGMNGVELAAALIEKVPACKVILLSGTTLDKLLKARAAGYGFPVLTKPIPPEVLLDYISNCLESRKPVDSSSNAAFRRSEKVRRALFTHSQESDINARKPYAKYGGGS